MIAGIIAGGGANRSVAPPKPYGRLVMLLAGPDSSNVLPTDTAHQNWNALYGSTMNVGVFAAQRVKPWDSGIQPVRVFNDFALSDVLEINANNYGSPNGGAIVDFYLDFFDSSDAVKARAQVRTAGANSVRLWMSGLNGNLFQLSVSGAGPVVAGRFSFTPGSIRWTPFPGYETITPAALNLEADMASVKRMRISNARVTIASTGSSATFGYMNRFAA
jgi:hypothetical protein